MGMGFIATMHHLSLEYAVARLLVKLLFVVKSLSFLVSIIREFQLSPKIVFTAVSLKNQRKKVHSGDYNFDHPDAFDWNLLEETLRELRDGKAAKIPTYDFVTHSRKDETYSKTIYSIAIILFEGILAFYQPNIRDLMNMKIFVDTDADTRLSRRILRDISERGRDLEGVLLQYQRFVKPSFDDYILPTKKICGCDYPSWI